MDLRDLSPDHAERIRELADSAMTASYRLSPQQIDAITDTQFGDDALQKAASDDDYLARVAANGVDDVDTAVAGVVVGRIINGVGEIRWLLVDPEHRGAGVGTALFESAVETLRERDVTYIQAATLETNTEGSQFFERFDFSRTEERTVAFGTQTLVEHVYTEPEAASITTDAAETEAGTADFPDTEVDDGVRTATTNDGQQMFLDTDQEESGSAGSFFHAYSDIEQTEPYGYYCGNCGSLDVLMDDMTRMECPDCGNSHATRSTGTYDGSYL